MALKPGSRFLRKIRGSGVFKVPKFSCKQGKCPDKLAPQRFPPERKSLLACRGASPNPFKHPRCGWQRTYGAYGQDGLTAAPALSSLLAPSAGFPESAPRWPCGWPARPGLSGPGEAQHRVIFSLLAVGQIPFAGS